MKLYDVIVLDVYNLFYKFTSLATSNDIVSEMIKYVEVDLAQVQKPNCQFYFLFDPLPINNLNIQKTVRRLPFELKSANIRKSISKLYKSNRKYDVRTFQTLFLFYRYLKFRNLNWTTIIAPGYEADDFVEPLLELKKDQQVLLISSDSDWARYLSDTVFLSKGNPQHQVDTQEFEKRYGFLPTISSLTFSKALLGDNADGITGALFGFKKLKPTQLILKYAKEWIVKIGQENHSIDEILSRIKFYSIPQLLKEKEKDAEKELVYFFKASEENIMQMLENNIRLIKSRCKDISPHTESTSTIDKNYCRIIDNMIFKKDGFKFGGLKK